MSNNQPSTLPPIGCFESTDSSCFFKRILVCYDGTYIVSFQDARFFDISGRWCVTNDKQSNSFLFYNFVIMAEDSVCRQDVPFEFSKQSSRNCLEISLPNDVPLVMMEVENFFSSHYQNGRPIRIGDVFFNGKNSCTVTDVHGIDGCHSASPDTVNALQHCGYNYGFLFECKCPPCSCVYDNTDEDMILFRRALKPSDCVTAT